VVIIQVTVFWVVCRVLLLLDTNISEDLPASISGTLHGVNPEDTNLNAKEYQQPSTEASTFMQMS
jgi:hypothetical protein